MAGSRKFSLEFITRDDIAALTREAAVISGIQYVMDVDRAQVEEILSAQCPESEVRCISGALGRAAALVSSQPRDAAALAESAAADSSSRSLIARRQAPPNYGGAGSRIPHLQAGRVKPGEALPLHLK